MFNSLKLIPTLKVTSLSVAIIIGQVFYAPLAHSENTSEEQCFPVLQSIMRAENRFRFLRWEDRGFEWVSRPNSPYVEARILAVTHSSSYRVSGTYIDYQSPNMPEDAELIGGENRDFSLLMTNDFRILPGCRLGAVMWAGDREVRVIELDVAQNTDSVFEVRYTQAQVGEDGGFRIQRIDDHTFEMKDYGTLQVPVCGQHESGSFVTTSVIHFAMNRSDLPAMDLSGYNRAVAQWTDATTYLATHSAPSCGQQGTERPPSSFVPSELNGVQAPVQLDGGGTSGKPSGAGRAR